MCGRGGGGDGEAEGEAGRPLDSLLLLLPVTAVLLLLTAALVLLTPAAAAAMTDRRPASGVAVEFVRLASPASSRHHQGVWPALVAGALPRLPSHSAEREMQTGWAADLDLGVSQSRAQFELWHFTCN